MDTSFRSIIFNLYGFRVKHGMTVALLGCDLFCVSNDSFSIRINGLSSTELQSPILVSAHSIKKGLETSRPLFTIMVWLT